ncbi:SpoIVB peptidase [Tumebacillus permanentifrigoris]|uniref:Stage IV sporulation protein B n=1 Tax=Tumebacillus permanentifrigoris TaxID=378543 RepID=A0A316D7B5_9BACL|nr:SpoIVB peptidase [Tumebacillus permanentifrigoris]PWK11547.1 stage IV sporulation protein B [Tumebacillus permanentifrigoris]
MTKHTRRKLAGLFVAILFVAMCWFTPIHQLASIPQELRVLQGAHAALDLGMKSFATVTTSQPDVISVSGAPTSAVSHLKQPLQLDSGKTGSADVKVKLFGLIPVKSVHVNVVPDLKVIPGGQSIGVKLKSSGIMVVGYNLVKQGKDAISPAEQAQVKVGDIITAIDGSTVKSVEQAAELINKAGKSGKPMEFTIKRQKELVKLKVKPLYDKDSEIYRIGLYIRDSAAGVGTLTFYAPDQKKFGALGHIITDVDTGQAIGVGEGQIVHSSVTSIDKGQSGAPGEKRGIFIDEDKVLGSITRNSDFGVFGNMSNLPGNAKIAKAMPVALAEQVHEGKASILTVVDSQKVEEFDIQIVNVMKQKFPATKSMVIKVTDKRLLEKTGGIIQGMSGSPILQDGKVVGAVTHVFVNDPTQGYGVFLEWMLNEAGIQTKTTVKS